ncbi:S1 family peptidase [Flavobacterium caeni]|uniref:Trypsin-like peptidase domain-containing protein n=1 Tax=Flavobacterium caeni TaxID=490189 RepID=A0A1G5KIP5_9FLAO|nr:serine protease [Flavobacterium caeni]SCZ00515.1 Trypsin-like peptidase domain-containing protein [Flavobacterium caeni]
MALSNDNVSYAAFLSLDQGSSTGSGFILSFKGKEYIITAKHVLFDGERLRCDSLLITSQNHLGEIDDAKTVVIDEMSEIKIVKSHDSDIAAIFLEDENHFRVEQEGKNIISIQEDNIDKLEDIRIANNILLIGFPTSLIIEGARFFDVNRPLLRKGIVAGINSKDNTFIIDCPVFYGNSGGPVVEYKENGEIKLIGIVSKYIPFVTEWRNNRESAFSRQEFSNSGYAVCVPIDEILTLLSK